MRKLITLLGFISVASIICAQPSNDDCSGAVTVPVSPFGAVCSSSQASTTQNATQSLPATGCSANNDDDVWYFFTATSSTVVVRISNAVLIPSGNANIGFEILNGTCGSITSVFCTPNMGSLNAHTIVNGLTAGQSYYIRFWTFISNVSSNFNFCIQQVTSPPANDECSGAIPVATEAFGLSCSSATTASTTGATQSLPNPSCTTTDNNDDIWYSFTANTTSVIIRFSNATLTTSSGNMNLAFALYNGACPSGTTTFQCYTNTGSSSGYQIVNGLVTGNTYYIRFWSLGINNYGNFNFCIQDIPPPPVNDDCNGAIVIPTQPFGNSCSASISANTTGATQSSPNPSCTSNDNNDDIWYAFTANSQSVIIRFSNAVLTTSSGNMNLGLALYAGNCPVSSTTFTCANLIGSNNGLYIADGLTMGTVYYLRFWSFGANNYGSFNFCVQDVPPPPVNNDCSGAIAISTQPFGNTCTAAVPATTDGATASSPNPSCAGVDNNDDVWYRFTCITPTVLIRFSNAQLTTTNGNMNFAFELYSGVCGSLTSVVCTNTAGSNSGTYIVNGLISGNTYFLRIWSFGNHNYGSFDFCVQDVPPPPVNNDCSGAITINPAPPTAACLNPIIASTAGATASANPPTCATAANLNDDIWYFFTATTPVHKLVITNALSLTISGNANIGYALYSASCPVSGTSFACSASTGSGSAAVNLAGLTPGNGYYLRLWSVDVHNFAGFKFCLLETPLNNECTGAVTIPITNGFCTTPISGTLSTATISAGFGVPACNPSGNATDVWYKLTVPATGNCIVQTSAVNTSVINLLMEAYSGSCGSLSLITCDDDGNPETIPSANHPRIVLTGRTPGEVLYLRVMPASLSNAGDFVICAWDSTITVLPDVAPGGNCEPYLSPDISAVSANRYMWVPVMDNNGRIVAEIYPDGNTLGNQSISLHVNNGPVREHDGKYYLDRSISFYGNITGTVQVRFYYTDAEVMVLKGVDSTVNPFNLYVYNSPDSCSSQYGSSPVFNYSQYYKYGTDHYLQFSLNAASTFYAEGECGTGIVWTGLADTNWHNPLNWNCNGVPWKFNEVYINNSAPRYPVITASTEIKTLYLDTGASLTIMPGVNLKINGQ